MTEDKAISAPSPISAPPAQVTEKEKPSGWAMVKSWVPRVIIGALIASALIAILAVITGEWGVFQTQLMYTVVLMVAFVLVSWYDADVSSKRSHRFAVTSVGLSIALVMLGLIYIWVYPNLYSEPYICDTCGSLPPGWEEQEMTARTSAGFFNWLWIAIITRVALLHAHLLLNIREKYFTDLLKFTASATLVVLSVVALMLAYPRLAEDFFDVSLGETYWRTFAVLVILDVLGTVLIPLSFALFRPKNKTHNQAPVFYENSYPRPEYVEATWQQAPQAPVAPSSVPFQNGQVAQPVYMPPTQVTQPPAGSVKFEPAPQPRNILAWPRYVDGRPLPMLPDGTPDFSQVERY